MSRWRAALAVIAAAVYAGAAYLLTMRWADSPAAIGLLFGPLVGAVLMDAVRSRHRPTLLLALALAALLALLCMMGSRLGMQRLYVVQHALVHAAFALAFAASLRAGAVPLITRIGLRVHTEFTPAMRSYTRRLTAVWAFYFGAMIVASLAIYALRPWADWALFGNLLTPLAAFGFFVVELLLRRWRHPEFERASIASVLRAWRAAAPLSQRASR